MESTRQPCGSRRLGTGSGISGYYWRCRSLGHSPENGHASDSPCAGTRSFNCRASSSAGARRGSITSRATSPIRSRPALTPLPRRTRSSGTRSVQGRTRLSPASNVGLIAQEVETALPELVHEDKEGYKHIRYQQVTALLVEAIKEQNAMIQKLSEKLAALGAV